MRQFATILTVAALIAAASRVLLANVWTVDPGGGGDFTTIQAAIDAAATGSGDTINATAGTYTESIDIHKAVSVVGLGGFGGTIIGGTANVGHGATLRGFTVGTATQGAFINGDGAAIEDCWIESTGTGASTHTIQIYPEYGTAAKNVSIKNSTIKTNTSGKAAIYVETRGLLDGFTLEGNTLIGDYGVTQSFGALNTVIRDNVFTGIAGSTKRAIQIKTSMDNILIENNDITGFAIGIRLDNNLADLGSGPVAITGNRIWDNAAENMQIKRAPNLQIADNEFSQSSAAPSIHIYAGYSDLDVDFINNNNILGTLGIQNDSTTLVDATSNWWGDPTGPDGSGAACIGDIDYSNWLTEPVGQGSQVIPEPAAAVVWLLGGVALLCCAAVRRRRGKV